MTEYIYGTDGHEGHWLTGEEVVRCRDCIHRALDPLGEYCTLFDFEDVDNQKTLNGFCAWGVKAKQYDWGK